MPQQALGVKRGGWQGSRRPAVQAAAINTGVRPIGGLGGRLGGGFGFTCNPWFCSCTGDLDCNDMFTTSLCGRAICIDDVCYCLRN
jgi:hypothetical protein